MSDILSKYSESKKEMQALSKDLFNLFQQNDHFKLLKFSDISTLTIEAHKDIESLVRLELGNYSDVLPVLVFDANRSVIFSGNEEAILSLWYDASKSEIERINFSKAQKFLKLFGQQDHDLINTIINNYANLESRGLTDVAIAKIAAKSITHHIESKLESKNEFI